MSASPHPGIFSKSFRQRESSALLHGRKRWAFTLKREERFTSLMADLVSVAAVFR
jgi:hypothetical protein